jgi:alkylation response protein AidB-like acyl-CoA dehydrogenase
VFQIPLDLSKAKAQLGYTDQYDVERFYRDAKVVEIYEGAKEIEKITIAREILGRHG